MDNAFDRHIKSALEQFEVPYDASTWAALEQRLAQLPGHTDTVDQALRSTLQGVEMSYQSRHWDLLAQRMATETKRRRRILFMKVIEAAAVFLLLFWAMPGSWIGDETKTNESLQIAASKTDQKRPRKDQDKKNILAGTPSTLLQRSDNQASELPMAGSSIPDLSLSPQTNKQFWSLGFQVLDVQDNTVAQNTTFPTSKDLTNNDLQSIEAQEVTLLGLKAFIPVPTNQPQKAFALIPQKAKRQSRMYMAAMASFDQNRIITTAQSLQRTQGYGAGVLVGYQKGQWALETGLVYNRKTYTPRKEVEIISGSINKGYNGQFVQHVDADLVSVPVRVARQVARFNRTRVKVTAGVDANLVLDKTYDAQNVFYPGFQTSGPTDPPQFSAAYNGRGVLEKGGLNGNSYLSLTGGVRLEHSINAQMALFAEANYQQALGGGKGIGPKTARIHTAGLNAGVIQRI